MLKSDVISYFKTQAAVARALEISEAAVSLWDEIIPEGSAYKIESLTKRRLRVNPELYSKAAVHARRDEQASAG
jgi:hypothetical protein